MCIFSVFQECVTLQESLANDIEDYYNERGRTQEVEQYQHVHSTIANMLFMTFVSQLSQGNIINIVIFVGFRMTKITHYSHQDHLCSI